MSSLGSRVATGATWMVGLRAFQRSLGLVSTVILARLLVPDDFGLVAMATAVYALVEIVGAFGFDLALIRDQKAERHHYDTAWTLNVAYKAVGAIAMALAAPYVAQFFGDPRAEAVIYAFAVISFLNGLENIGIVAFRKELSFNKEFAFRFTKTFGRVAITIVAAFLLQSYWALVIGSLTGAVLGLVLSYAMHSFRPTLSISGARSLFRFSVWVLLNNFAMYGRERGPDLIVGRLVGADALGGFRVATDIAKLPTAELYAPIMRAVFPGFSKISHDIPRLKQAYLSAQGVVTTAMVPAAIGIVSVAEPLVWTLLGANWLQTVPLIQVLGLVGVVRILQGNRFSLFMALGKPYWVFIFVFAEALLTLPALGGALYLGFELAEAVWAAFFSSLLLMPPGVTLVCRQLDMKKNEFAGVLWRPPVAAAFVAGVNYFFLSLTPDIDSFLSAISHLAILVPLGVLIYGGVLLSLWFIVGRPEGAESRIIEMATEKGLLKRFWSDWLTGQATSS